MLGYRAKLTTVTAIHIRRSTIALVLMAWLLVNAPPTYAALTFQNDPAAQCAEGVWHFTERRVAQARPLLEAGFAGWKQTHFVDPFLGFCALDVGQLREEAGNLDGALEGYTVALDFLNRTATRPLRKLFSRGSVKSIIF